MAVKVVTTPEQVGIKTQGMLKLFNRCIALGYTWYIDTNNRLCCEPSEVIDASITENDTEV